MRRTDFLFYTVDWFSQLEAQRRGLDEFAQKLQAADFARASLDQLADELFKKCALDIPTVDPANIEVSQKEAMIELSPADRFSYGDRVRAVKGTSVTVYLPFGGDGDMFKVQPSTYDMNPPRGHIDGKNVVFTISGANLDAAAVRRQIDATIASIQTYLGYQRSAVEEFHADLRRRSVEAINRRKAKVDGDKSLIDGLGFKQRSGG